MSTWQVLVTSAVQAQLSPTDFDTVGGGPDRTGRLHGFTEEDTSFHQYYSTDSLSEGVYTVTAVPDGG